jgi:predicted RNA-binding protein associated with RNAse of E/G family
MRSCGNVPENYALEVATADALVIEEDVIAVVSQVLVDVECPRDVGAAVADEDGLFDALLHIRPLLSLRCGQN